MVLMEVLARFQHERSDLGCDGREGLFVPHLTDETHEGTEGFAKQTDRLVMRGRGWVLDLDSGLVSKPQETPGLFDLLGRLIDFLIRRLFAVEQTTQ
jgi:hypothetical protein